MNPKILIRTYAPDAQWLEWCLLSCKQRVPEIPVVVVCPIEAVGKVGLVTRKFGIPPQGVYPAHANGYMDQQWTKLNADAFCTDCDYIIHVDSDCVWTAGVEGLFREGRPIMLKTPYSDLGDAVPWQKITEKALGFRSDYEYMRRQPLTYPRWVYAACREHLRSVHEDSGLEKWFSELPNREFSEFNVLGAWCDMFTPDSFEWLDTSCAKPLPEPVMRQGWSWGGMTPEIKAEWRTLVKEVA